jgi:hypothetical protein
MQELPILTRPNSSFRGPTELYTLSGLSLIVNNLQELVFTLCNIIIVVSFFGLCLDKLVLTQHVIYSTSLLGHTTAFC